jgi:glucan phosphoethanolaminetransferase (alkaline phosphatase superfamily)
MRKTIKIIFFETLVWYSLPTLFLIFYIGKFHSPTEAAFQHLYAITLVSISAIFSRVLICRLMSKAVAAFVAPFIYSLVLFLLAIYYCLVLIGLKSWGRVITEELVISYAFQAPQLLGQLNTAPGVALLILAVSFFSFFATFFYIFKKYAADDSGVSEKVRPHLINFLLICSFLFTAYYLRDYLLSPNLLTKEPFHLTLYSGKSNIISHSVQANPLLDKQEGEAMTDHKYLSTLQKKNVVLIIVDALRPDHMGVYGYERDTTPYLSELVKTGRVTKFNNVRASCGESACGLASIASSRYVHQMPTTPITLQTVLQLQGYQINMILGGDHTNFYNLKAMYGKVDSYFDGSMAKDFYMNDDALVLERVKSLPIWSGIPTLFQFHLMSTHTLGKRWQRSEKFKPARGYAGITEGASRQEYINYYDNGVLQADAVIKDLIYLLETKNYLKNSLVVITADHGESLGEHNLIGHASSVREEQLRIPLLLIDFDKNAKLSGVGNQFFSQVDIAPTVLQDLGIATPNTWRGKSIQLASSTNGPPEITFFQMHNNIGLYDHRQSNSLWKYWINLHSNQEFAFNLSTDPRESDNLISSVPITIRNEWHRLAYSMRLKEFQH